MRREVLRVALFALVMAGGWLMLGGLLYLAFFHFEVFLATIVAVLLVGGIAFTLADGGH